MTNQEILQKVFDKALANGWFHAGYIFAKEDPRFMDWDEWVKPQVYYPIIFSHDFAKALWGENEYCDEEVDIHSHPQCCSCEYPLPRPHWEIQLQHMVISEDPLQYLAQFVEEK